MQRRLTTQEFIAKAKAIHGDKYDYSKSQYKKSSENLVITCPIHGDFLQRPNKHLLGQGCPLCSNKNKTTQQYIEQARAIHGDKYDYTKTIYKGAKQPITVTCPIHGDFQIEASRHLQGQGCKYCAGRMVHDTSSFIEQAKAIHGDKYDYSKSQYNKSAEKLTVTCPTHGDFLIKPNHHLSGVGCPICKASRLEQDVRKLLQDNHISFHEQQTFDWLGKMSLDFYLPLQNIAIECQGIQHFQPTQFFGGETAYEYVRHNDERKAQLCTEQNIKLIYYTNIQNTPSSYFGTIYKERDKLLEALR